ncbi:hypothetical protein [Micromonospora parathelypteridis]|uniref:Pimeloyl-ACP methyl ester carboxylesterase n=1 Tax=Micromonospora parathelypteridis TaxID=1839617 RepID=A0A840VLM2_9ACTN|nr:hypothetical protein [Micromonospora parathelypteridis]MBB5477637.1 pimeloyl-ACP methyl ester carboxylesterase [Micromonospora parathelypteridis]GGO10885.1 hypothetical protein GCM10011576_18750 [Micromonospora parathelypteridis]
MARGVAHQPTEVAYPNVSYFSEADSGGHFPAWEVPELFSAEMRAAFRPLRNR